MPFPDEQALNTVPHPQFCLDLLGRGRKSRAFLCQRQRLGIIDKNVNISPTLNKKMSVFLRFVKLSYVDTIRCMPSTQGVDRTVDPAEAVLAIRRLAATRIRQSAIGRMFSQEWGSYDPRETLAEIFEGDDFDDFFDQEKLLAIALTPCLSDAQVDALLAGDVVAGSDRARSLPFPSAANAPNRVHSDSRIGMFITYRPQVVRALAEAVTACRKMLTNLSRHKLRVAARQSAAKRANTLRDRRIVEEFVKLKAADTSAKPIAALAEKNNLSPQRIYQIFYRGGIPTKLR